ncbi:hypothetical protein ES703_09863 [subsurface metagenome]
MARNSSLANGGSPAKPVTLAQPKTSLATSGTTPSVVRMPPPATGGISGLTI